MMELSALLIDDEPLAQDNLSKFLEKNCPDVNILGFAGSVNEAILMINQCNPDVIFLDVKMKDGTGFDVLDAFPQREFEVIFVTAFNKHAIKAFDYAAKDYLLKPLNKDAVIRAVNRVSTFIEILASVPARQDSGKFLEVKTKEGHKLINLEELEYLEADNNYAKLFLHDKSMFLSTKGLKEFEQQLPKNFFRTHQSFIINIYRINYYRKTSNEIVMKSGAVAKISRRKKDLFTSLIAI